MEFAFSIGLSKIFNSGSLSGMLSWTEFFLRKKYI